MRKKFLGHSWLGWLNYLILQWFFLRFTEILYKDDSHMKWSFLWGVVPLSGWSNSYVFVRSPFVRQVSPYLVSNLAGKQHAIWSHWMMYMFSQGEDLKDGSWKMPVDKVERWKKQAKTLFIDLTDDEKKSEYDIIEKFELKKLFNLNDRII